MITYITHLKPIYTPTFLSSRGATQARDVPARRFARRGAPCVGFGFELELDGVGKQ